MEREKHDRLEKLALSGTLPEELVRGALGPGELQKHAGRWNWRGVLKSLFSLRNHVMVGREVLDELFAMERKTLITLMLIETISLYILVPLLGDGVFVWYGLILTLTMWRYYNGYDYLKHPERNTPLIWHEKLVVQTWMTALLFSLLALFAMPLLDKYYQLFVFIVIMGVSAGGVKTLADDHRTAIGYLLILLFPLMVEMLLLGRQETFILAFLVLIYLVTQISILLRSYEQSHQLKRAKRILEEARELLYEKQEILQRFFEQAAEGIFTYNGEFRILDCNQAFLSLFHFRRSEVVGKRITELPDEKLVTILQAALVEGAGNLRSYYRSRGGQQLWVEAKCSPLYDSEGKTIGGLGLVEDKTREELTMEKPRYLVSHDPLTSALNRRGFWDYMYELVRKGEHRKLPTLLFYLDLDHFKRINDVYGHAVGDRILQETARRLKNLLPEEGRLSRLGGDEFAMVVPFVDLRPSREALIESWVERIEKELTKAYIVEGQEIENRASIGVFVVEAGSDAIDEMIQAADISMFHAKRDSGKRYVLYAPDMKERHRELHIMYRELKTALKENRFELYFQPFVRARDRRVVSAEVLLRWNHPRKGVLSPTAFLTVARKFNLIAEIDRWVLEHACRQIARWKEQGEMPLHSLSVNIDARLLLRESFPTLLKELFERYGIGKGEIVLEITEDSLVDNFERARKVLMKLQEMGIDCAIDDFGTGYSSLSYLKKLSFTILKIDREFVRDMLDRIENIFLLQTIIDMGKKLNYRIVIEGIETERQMEIVTGIDGEIECQGYLFGAPMDEKSFRSYLAGQRDRREKR